MWASGRSPSSVHGVMYLVASRGNPAGPGGSRGGA